MAHIPRAFLWAALAVCSLKASAVAKQPEDRPSAADFQTAMDEAFMQEMAGMTNLLFGDCLPVRNLQCFPARHGRSRCSYIYPGTKRGRSKRGTAILERKPNGSWRWVSGPYHCAAGVIGE